MHKIVYFPEENHSNVKITTTKKKKKNLCTAPPHKLLAETRDSQSSRIIQ